jgi:hypothetical protein
VDTIIAIPRPRKLKRLTYGPGDLPTDAPIQDAQLKIRLANTEGRRSTVSYLIKRRYAWRGYQAAAIPGHAPNRITLAAFDAEQTIATLTVGVDSPAGLGVEELYPDEVKALRATRGQLCEFTRLAVDNMVQSRTVLAAIFHIAYIYGHRIRGCSDVVIEVNPRHVRFYRSMLGFELLGEERIDPRVKAPAVLLRLEFAHAEAEIARLGGHAELADQVRLLYPLFFSAQEEQGIEGRLRSMD